MEKDYIKRYVNNELGDAEVASPMEPPDQFAPPSVEQVPFESLAQPLQGLMDEHEAYEKALSVFENALLELKKNDWKFNPEISAGLKTFFQYFDEETTVHNKKEEKCLFPLLRERFLESGEHSPIDDKPTPTEVMEEEHLDVSHSVALVFNFLGISSRLEDQKSRNLIIEHAFNLGQEIVETMKLHIYRENTMIFPLAHQLISKAEFEDIENRMKVF